MRYVKARVKQALDEMAYRIYITDALKVIGGLNIRYADLIKRPIEETRTKEEIIESIRRRLK